MWYLSDMVKECYICLTLCLTKESLYDVHLCADAKCHAALKLERDYVTIRSNRSVCPVQGRCLKYNDCPYMQDAVPTYHRMADEPSSAEFWGLALPNFDQHDIGDFDRTLAYEDIRVTGNDADVVDGILGACDPDLDHLNIARDHFEGNPHYEIDDSGRATASALYVYTLEELALLPEDIEEARPFHASPEITKAPYKDRFCPMYEPGAPGYAPNAEGNQTLWSTFAKLCWVPGNPRKSYKTDRYGWTYKGKVLVYVTPGITVPVPGEDLIIPPNGVMVEFFIRERNGKTKAPEYKAENLPKLSSNKWRLSNALADGVAEWVRRLRVYRHHNLRKYTSTTRKEYEARVKAISERKNKR